MAQERIRGEGWIGWLKLEIMKGNRAITGAFCLWLSLFVFNCSVRSVTPISKLLDPPLSQCITRRYLYQLCTPLWLRISNNLNQYFFRVYNNCYNCHPSKRKYIKDYIRSICTLKKYWFKLLLVARQRGVVSTNTLLLYLIMRSHMETVSVENLVKLTGNVLYSLKTRNFRYFGKSSHWKLHRREELAG